MVSTFFNNLKIPQVAMKELFFLIKLFTVQQYYMWFKTN